MPTNHDETLEQRYAREQVEHLAELAKRTPEEIAYMEQLLHNALTERDQLATKVADTELALFAENQKRQDVEKKLQDVELERDQLLKALDKLLKDAEQVRRVCLLEVGIGVVDEIALDLARAAIAAVKGGQCQTCNGHGMIGGPSYSQPDEGGEPCPDCQQPAVAVAVQDGAAEKLVEALEKLARLGAGERYGNSDGNVIAQQALAEYRHMLEDQQKGGA